MHLWQTGANGPVLDIINGLTNTLTQIAFGPTDQLAVSSMSGRVFAGQARLAAVTVFQE